MDRFALARDDERGLVKSRRIKGEAQALLGTAFTVPTGEHHHIPVQIAQPNLPVSGRGIEVSVFDNLRAQPASALDRGVEIFDLEPQHDAMSRRRRVGVDEIGMVFRVPSVELK